MSDLINIKDERFWDILFHEACVEGEQAERIEKELKKITVEPVRGEWIYTPTYREYECSNCKSMINLSDDANAHLNFCPQCGCDMRKKVEE